ncbi:MAG TPA: ParB N-terminal domain-containing protein [Candidatus Paceibacterota bacterium]
MRRPKILEDAGFDIYADTSRLRDLPLPVTQVEVKELAWYFDLPVWEKEGTDEWNLTPREVMDGKEGSAEHKSKVDESDLGFPIVIVRNRDKWVILDGIHRLVKAYLLGKETIDAKIVTKGDRYLQSAQKTA